MKLPLGIILVIANLLIASASGTQDERLAKTGCETSLIDHVCLTCCRLNKYRIGEWFNTAEEIQVDGEIVTLPQCICSKPKF